MRVKRLIAVSAALATIGFASGAQAGTATSSFTFGANSLILTLENTTVNPSSVADNLSAFQFTVTGATGASLTGAISPTYRNINPNGTYTDSAGPNTIAGVGWVFTDLGGGTFLLDVLSGAGHAGPENTLLGQPDASNLYSNANNSLRDNDAHNPFLNPTITFTFSFTGGVTAGSQATDTMVQFGTTDGQLVPSSGGHPSSTGVPEPSSSSLALLGLALVAGAFLKRRSAQRA